MAWLVDTTGVVAVQVLWQLLQRQRCLFSSRITGLVLLEWKYFPTPKILDPLFVRYRLAMTHKRRGPQLGPNLTVFIYLCPHDVPSGLNNARGDLGVVHGVQVNTVHSVRQEVDNLVNGVGDTRIAQSVRFVGETVDQRLQLFWDRDAIHHVGGLLSCHEGHDTGLNGYGDARKTATFLEVVELPVVVKQLGNQLAGARVHFTFEVLDIRKRVGRLGMTLGVAGPNHVEITPRVDVAHQVARERKVVAGTARRGDIPAQRQDVLDTRIL